MLFHVFFPMTTALSLVGADMADVGDDEDVEDEVEPFVDEPSSQPTATKAIIVATASFPRMFPPAFSAIDAR
jgi:hypothetical protein